MRAAYRSLLLGPITAGAVIAALVNPGLAGAAPGTVTAASAGSPRSNVIVLLKDQHKTSVRTSALRSRHTQTLHASQAGVVSAAKKLGGRDIHQFGLVNAVSVNLSSASAKALAAQPDVAAVVPDLPIQRPAASLDHAIAGRAGAAASQTTAAACTTHPAKPLFEPEALQTMDVKFNDGTPGVGSLSTGKGVKVAWLADGLDVNNPDFIRNGKSIFVDHKDFSTEGWDAPSSAAEAFGDASSIAAQGNQTYDLADVASAAHPLPAGCTIRVQGVAPGADLVGLKVFGNAPTAPTSRFIQAIEYAVNVDNVDVINESFGSNPYPDTQDDPISLADSAAVAAGVTVVVSTGDAGVNGTIGSPSSSKDVIAVGATTQFRSYAQTTFGGYNLPGVKAWASDNISAISSAGFAQNGKVPDLVAPGDLGWALCSKNTAVFLDCIDLDGNPADIQNFGGTSQSSPLTAGAAALVISAYEKAHPGAAKPSPALVKRLLTSTARDLGHPAQLQGAGEVDALAAVKAAMSVPSAGSSARPKLALGTALLVDKPQLDLSATAGSTTTARVKVTNLSARTQTVKASTRSLTKTLSSTTGSINFDGATLPTFPNVVGSARAFVAKKFTVKPGADRLDVDTAFNSYPRAVFTALVDPHGVYQAYSLPQGAANFADVSVRYPSAGKWTAYVFADPAFSGKVSFHIKTSGYTTLGTVTPTVVIRAGKTATLSYKVPVPKNPGDTAASIQLRTALGVTSSVPVSLRGTIAASKSRVKSFKGVITGGNGRDDGGAAQTNTYYIDVPKKAPSMSVGVKLTGQTSPDAIDYGYLVAPNGQALSAPSNVRVSGNGLVAVPGLQLYANAPAAGRWTLVVEASNPIAGNLVSQPFTGTVSLAKQPVTVKPMLPTSAKVALTAGKTVLAKVKVTNSGVVPMTYFADARLKKYGTYSLASQVPGDDLSSVDLPESLVAGQWLVPTHTYSVSFGADATEPVQLDAGWAYGDPEVFGDSAGNKSTAIATATKLAPGPWSSSAGVVGPFAGPAPDGSVAYTAIVKTRKFDPAVESSTGDFWPTAFIPAPANDPAVSRVSPLSAGSHWANALRRQAASQKVAAVAKAAASGPLTLAPGKSATITIAITPPASAKGKVTTGTLYIDSFDFWTGTGDEVAGLPYMYRVKK